MQNLITTHFLCVKHISETDNIKDNIEFSGKKFKKTVFRLGLIDQ